MRVLVVSEGLSELGGALPTLVRRLMGQEADVTCERVSSRKVRVHGLTRRALAWVRYAEREGFAVLVLVIDQDGKREREKQMDSAQNDIRMSFPRALGLAIRTFDAWMLADERALASALGHNVDRQRDPEKIRDPRGLCDQLRNDIPEDLRLPEMYASIAQVVDIETLEKRCPRGFAPFAERVRQLESLH